jgi:peptidoglycan glycosyltransferase
MMASLAGNIRSLTVAISVAFFVTSLAVGYWTMVAAEELSGDAFNPRLVAASRDRPRGRIVDRTGRDLAVSVQQGGTFRRVYADRTLAQVTGYASFTYGAAGIEAAYAESLIGQDPADPLARWRARYLRDYGQPGVIVLGIDPAVQAAASAALGGRRGAVVALDPRSGAVIASVSLPNYEPTLVSDPRQEDLAWRQATGNEERPLLDRARQGLYPPGSTFKIVTAAAALEGGLDPKARIWVDDPFRADPSWGDYAVRSATAAHGEFDLSLAFQRSENIYFAKIALQIGGARLAEQARRFGIGRAPSSDLPAARGQLSNSGSLERPVLLADTAFGQGELLVSPVSTRSSVRTSEGGK